MLLETITNIRRKIFFVLLIITINTLQISAQHIKTYSGKFKGGTATYQYYENENYERIYHGSFNADISYWTWDWTLVMQGHFSNNLRNGNWLYLSKIKNKPNLKAKGRFVNGIMEGEWIFSEIQDGKTKVISKCNFTNGKLVGSYIYNSRISTNGTTWLSQITGSFNELNQLSGKWIIKYSNIEDIRKYSNGVLYWRLKRNIETGKVFQQFDSTSFINNIMKNYDGISNTATYDGYEYVFQSSKYDDYNIGSNHYTPKVEDIIYPQSDYDVLNSAIDFWYNKGLGIVAGGYFEIIFKDTKGVIFKNFEYKNKLVSFSLTYKKRKQITDSINLKESKRYLLIGDSLYMEGKITESLNSYVSSNSRLQNQRATEQIELIEGILKKQELKERQKREQEELIKKKEKVLIIKHKALSFMNNKKFDSAISEFYSANAILQTDEITKLLTDANDSIVFYRSLCKKTNNRYQELVKIYKSVDPTSLVNNMNSRYFDLYFESITYMKQNSTSIFLHLNNIYMSSNKLMTYKTGNAWNMQNDTILKLVYELDKIVSKMEIFNNRIKIIVKDNDKVKLKHLKEKNLDKRIEFFIN